MESNVEGKTYRNGIASFRWLCTIRCEEWCCWKLIWWHSGRYGIHLLLRRIDKHPDSEEQTSSAGHLK
jgi:hypothetical protein